MIFFVYGGVCVGKDACRGISDQERENSQLSATAFAHIMFFHQRLISMVGDGMEVQIKGLSLFFQSWIQSRGGIKPCVRKLLGEVGIAPSGIFGERGTFRDCVESGKEG